WSRQSVASVSELGQRILGRDGLDRHPHGLPEGLLGASTDLAQDGCDLRKRLCTRGAIGVQSGEEGDRKSRGQWRASRAWRLRAAVWTLKVSSTTICPGRRGGASCSAMDHAKVAVSLAPSISQGTCKPSGASAATSVVCFP